MEEMDSVIELDSISMEIWEEMAKEGSDAVIEVNTRGVSMWPLLRSKNDGVKIIYPRRDLAVGDFVVFHRSDGTEIAHRVCWQDAQYVQTIGDNCSSKDKKITRDKVFGHVETPFWRFYGRFMLWSNPVRMFIRDKMYRPLRSLARRIIKGK